MEPPETTILIDDGSPSGSSVSSGLGSDANATTAGSAAGATPTEETPEQLRARIAELEQQSAQYKRERVGWETQSRKNLEDRNALAERLARLEGQIDATSGRSTTTTPEPADLLPKGRLKSALQKWLDGDDSDLDTVEEALIRIQQPTQAATIKPEDIQNTVRQELATLGQKAGVQQLIGAKHQDMQNPQSELYGAVYANYDQYASDRGTQLMYPEDDRYIVPMTGPDGSQKMVDARIVDRLAADLRLQGAVQEGARQEHRASTIGGVQSGNGRQPRNRSVEAISLLTPGEQSALENPAILKGWPEMAAIEGTKARAKAFFDKLPAADKAKRLAEYRQRAR